MPSPLKNKKKIELLFRLGEKRGSEVFECRCLSSSENEGETRFVVVAPKKNFPRAVDRNKIKRMVKSSFSNSLQDLPCFDFVVLVNKGGAEEVKRDCELIFKKVLSA